jgi:hypothetical protein
MEHPTPPATDTTARDPQPQDEGSGLVRREWRRIGRGVGILTEQTMEGEHVRATWLEQGAPRRAAGIVRRNGAGELVIASQASGTPEETRVPRDANVDKGWGR